MDEPNKEKFTKDIELLSSVGELFWKISTILATVTLYLIVLFGSVCSMLLLAKLYPDIYHILSFPMMSILITLFRCVFIFLTIMVGLLFAVLILYAARYFNRMEIKRKAREEENDEKIIKEIVTRINKGKKR
jgi:hypothetical protein